MKIEDSSYPFGSTSPVEKLRRSQNLPDWALDDLDLSFLDLLTTVAADGTEIKPEAVKDDARTTEKGMDAKSTATKEGKTPPKLTLVGKVSTSAPPEEVREEADPDMILRMSDLTDIDIQYMKQAVIPGLPIIMGTVPAHSIFPAAEDGGISYRGFDVSGKLSEMIEKGFKTGRPIRVELDPKSAIVLKIRNGQVSAEFLSSEKGALLGMQQELDDLRNKMAGKNLPVGTLDVRYRDPRRQQQERDERQDQDA